MNPEPALHRRSSSAGFTMVELVVVITIMGLVAGVLSNFIARPMEGYRDLMLRSMLVDSAESAIRIMARDIHASLPNSLRVSGDGRSLELLHLVDGARYRSGPDLGIHTAAADWLDFSGDTQFNVLGRFSNLSFTYGTALVAGHRLAIYNTSTAVYTDASSDADPGVITPSGTTITISDDTDEDAIMLSSPFEFSLSSARQRLFIVDTPISYLCDLPAQTLTRYSVYSIASAQPTNPAIVPLSGGSAALTTQNLSSCAFSYDPGSPTRTGLVTVSLTLASGGEQVRLFHQIHVDNTP